MGLFQSMLANVIAREVAETVDVDVDAAKRVAVAAAEAFFAGLQAYNRCVDAFNEQGGLK